MSALICDICGGSLSMDGSGEFAVCDACGMRHSKERVRVKVQEVKGTVEVVTGMAEKERLLANAETFLKLEQYSKAEETFRSVSEQFPDDYRGWWGVCKAILLAGFQFKAIDCYTQNMKNAYRLCQEKEVFLAFFRELFAGYGGKIRTSSICPYDKSRLERHIVGRDYYAYMDKNGNELEQITVADESFMYLLCRSDIICEACPLDELKQFFSTLCTEYESKVHSGEIAIDIGVPSSETSGKFLFSPITKSLWERSEMLSKKLEADHEVFAQILSDHGVHVNIGFRIWIVYVFGPRIYYQVFYPGEEDARHYVCTLSQPITEEMIDTAANTVMQQKRMQNHQCKHCGGEFKGLFSKSCVKCGKPKDY